jgi:hypothetical protein
LENLKAAALANPKLRQATNPGGLAGDFFNLSPLAGTEHIQRH